MRHMLTNGCTLFVGAEAEHQSTVALEAVFDALVHGATIIGLCETEGDILALQAQMRLMLRAHKRNPEHLERVFGLSNYRAYHDAAILADMVVRAAKRPGASLNDTRDGNGLVVFSDRARDMLACQPGDHRIGVCADLTDWLPNARIVISAHHGSAQMPPPHFTLYRSDRVWRCQASHNKVTATEIKPGTERHEFVLRNLGGILGLDQMEKSDA